MIRMSPFDQSYTSKKLKSILFNKKARGAGFRGLNLFIIKLGYQNIFT